MHLSTRLVIAHQIVLDIGLHGLHLITVEIVDISHCLQKSIDTLVKRRVAFVQDGSKSENAWPGFVPAGLSGSPQYFGRSTRFTLPFET